MTTAPTSRPTESTPPRRWARSPVDAANVIVGIMLVVSVVAVAVFLEQAARGMSEDFVELFEAVPVAVDQLVLGLIQLALFVATGATVVLLVWRRLWRCLGVLLLAAAAGAAGGALIFSLVDDVVPGGTEAAQRASSFVTGAGFPSPLVLAGVASVVTAASPWLSRRHRRAAWIAAVVLAAARLLTTTSVPTTAAGMLAVGFLAGSLTLLVTGSPERRPTLSAVAAAMGAMGVPVAELELTGHEAAYSSTMTGRGVDGAALFVKTVDADSRDASLLFRTLRVLRVKGLEDEHPNRPSAQTVERAAVAGFLAAEAGARTPHVLAIGATDDGASVLVTEQVAGRRLEDLAADEVTDAVMDDLWSQVQGLADHRIAHRWLNGHHVLVTPDDRAVLTDFRWSILGANDTALAADVAELLCSLAVAVGPDRAVAGAVRTLGPTALEAAAPLLQPLALTRPTRARLADHDGLLDEVRERVQAATGGDEVELAELRRVTPWTLLTWVGVTVLASFLLAVTSNLGEIWDALQIADWATLPWIVVAVALTYVAGAALLAGVATVRLPLASTSWMMLAQSFLNRFTPANSGGMAMRVRFLQRKGEELSTAASSIALTSAAGGVMHWVILLVFVLWAGSSDQLEFEGPDVNLVAVGLAALGVAAGVVFFTTFGRETVLPWVRSALATVADQLRTVGRSPGRIAAVVTGAAGQKLLLIIAFYLTLEAFSIDMGFAEAGSLYLIATTIGSAVPTPGGVGGVEAALTAALTSAGVDDGLAFSVVLIFRLLSYWLPVPFGWVALRDVERRDLV